MSDLASLPWQRWQPEDLTQPVPQAEAEAQSVSETADGPQHADEFTTPAPSEMEVLQQQIRTMAQQQGFSEGQKNGFAEGQKAGYEAGFQQGLTDAQQQQAPLQARMQQLASGFEHALDALDGAMSQRLLQIALTAARSALGSAVQPDSSALQQQIRSMMQDEPLFSGKPVLHLHPEDIPHLGEALSDQLQLHGWQVQSDDSLHPGGCRVTAEQGELDSSLATRWQELCRLAAPGGC